MPRPACVICGKPMRLYGTEWKCMTSPADHNRMAGGKGHSKRRKKGKKK